MLRNLAFALGLAFAVEAVTVFLRFGLGMQSTRDTAWLAPLTGGWRIHHGYIGLLMLIVAPFLSSGKWKDLLIIVGFALVASDLVHHFVVLKMATGSAEFHLKY